MNTTTIIDDTNKTTPPKNMRWSKTPSFLLRSSAVMDCIRPWKPGIFLEAGIGTGTMSKALLSAGYTGYGYDITEENLEIAKRNLTDYKDSIELLGELSENKLSAVDYLFAFEVLEHIEQDDHALSLWAKHLTPGGKVLISVPARMRNFRADDHYVGHVRRYERHTLKDLLKETGFEDIKIISYGVPLLNLSRRVGALLHRSQISDMADSKVDRSIHSGVSRPKRINALAPLINESTLYPFSRLQRLFYKLDWGEGYIATAVKSH